MVTVAAVLAGLGIEKGIELVFDGATKVFSGSLNFNSSVRDFAYGVDYLERHIEPVDDQNRELNRTIQKARGLLNKCRNVSRWNIIKRHRYTSKLLASRKALRIHVRILVLELRHQILELSRRYGDKSVESANVENEILHLERYLAMVEENGIMNYLVPSFNGGMGVPLKDVPSINPKDDHITIKASSFHVGLDVPLRELKKKLFTDGVSMLVVTGIGGCGKTILAKQFCQDDQVKDKFKKNIFFVTVSKRPNLDHIIHQLYQQMGSEASIFQNNISAVTWLEQFLMEAGQNPLLLVLDDVWSGSEPFLQKLEELNKMPNHKLLVTSRSEFPGLGSPYYLNLSNSKEAMDLNRLASTPTSANSVVPMMERREVMADVELRTEFKADIQAVRGDMTNILHVINQLLVYLIQSKIEDPERTKEIKFYGMDVDPITRNFKQVTQELPILATEQQTMRQFRAWISDPDDGRRNLEIFEASKKWFKDLMTPGVWLSDTQIDVCLYFVRKSTHHHSQPLSQCCTILDTVFWSWMTGRWKSFQENPNSYLWDSDIMGYPLGKSPQFTRLWSEVDYLYMPVNVTNQHWVAVCVDLMRRKFTIYDSMRSATPDEFICDLLNPIATMFPSLLIQSGFYAMRPELSSLNTPFKVVCLTDDIPQQSESGDCGIFMLKFVEYLSSGQQLSFREEDIPPFRERLAFHIFAMSHDSGGTVGI